MCRATGIIVSLVVLLASGCTHHQLAYDHIKQAGTLPAINERQVLDNLAMFVDNPDAVPFFAVPGAGSAVVTDDGGLSVSTLNGPGHSILGPLGLGRNNRLTFATAPVTDPNRLSRMRCAYRRALGIGDGSDCCIDCCELSREWVAAEDGDYAVCCDCCSIRPLKIERCKKQLTPNPCEKVGHYCGTHIRVCPESYGDFSRLVLKIMDYAVNAPAPRKTMQVQRLVYDEGTGRLEKIQSYSAAFATEEEARLRGEKFTDAAPLVLEGDPVPPPAYPSPAAGLPQLQELQILRNSVFPAF